MRTILSKTKLLLTPSRRWFQFRLRTLLFAMTLLAAWLGLHLHSTRLQKRSAEVIDSIGGRVRYDYEYPKGTYGRDDFDYSATSPVPGWLLELLGVDFFHDVVEIKADRDFGYSRRNPRSDDDLIARLSGCPELRRLELRHCGITDNALRSLAAFPLLESLDLSHTSVTDDGIVSIDGFSSLKWLDLGHTRVGGRGFHRLARLKELQVLILSFTPIRDEALARMTEIERLQYVNVHSCRHLTPGGVAAFQQSKPTCELAGLASVRELWRREDEKRGHH